MHHVEPLALQTNDKTQAQKSCAQTKGKTHVSLQGREAPFGRHIWGTYRKGVWAAVHAALDSKQWEDEEHQKNADDDAAGGQLRELDADTALGSARVSVLIEVVISVVLLNHGAFAHLVQVHGEHLVNLQHPDEAHDTDHPRHAPSASPDSGRPCGPHQIGGLCRLLRRRVKNGFLDFREVENKTGRRDQVQEEVKRKQVVWLHDAEDNCTATQQELESRKHSSHSADTQDLALVQSDNSSSLTHFKSKGREQKVRESLEKDVC